MSRWTASGQGSAPPFSDASSAYGCETWTGYPPGAGAAAAASQEMRASLVPVYPGQRIHSVLADYAGAAALTLARIGLYDYGFNLLASTPSFHATINGLTAFSKQALSADYIVPAGVRALYVAYLFVGTTPPTQDGVTVDSTIFGANNARAGWRMLLQADLPALAVPVAGSFAIWTGLSST